ncbi:hypothetical protein EDC30_102246 [Paucimonas lemoignei]|uniref:Uncharacterized protein n=1 Tax=Paucimonas lemoignei TaxID=29443 RepID=A0A4R3HYQ4_PAULE|nr:hypothetical protein [Paucimonas lemoignei]TCS38507.1 hypothetical protein EDC30_102246 [Paucimonas lemoignei]
MSIAIIGAGNMVQDLKRLISPFQTGPAPVAAGIGRNSLSGVRHSRRTVSMDKRAAIKRRNQLRHKRAVKG